LVCFGSDNLVFQVCCFGFSGLDVMVRQDWMLWFVRIGCYGLSGLDVMVRQDWMFGSSGLDVWLFMIGYLFSGYQISLSLLFIVTFV